MDRQNSNLLTAIHPGEILREDFLRPMGLDAADVAQACRVPQRWLDKILRGKAPITGDTALRLAAFFGTTSILWMNLQVRYDIRIAEERAGADIALIQRHEIASSIGPKI